MKPKDEKEVIFGVKMPISMRENLISCASRNDQTGAQIIRAAVREYIRRNGQGDLFSPARSKS